MSFAQFPDPEQLLSEMQRNPDCTRIVVSNDIDGIRITVSAARIKKE